MKELNSTFYILGEGLTRSAQARPYDVPTNELQQQRNLQIYALDPSISRYHGSVSHIKVPLEPKLSKGPSSQLFKVIGRTVNICGVDTCVEVDLDGIELLRNSGLSPDIADWEFHTQMVYGVALYTYETFRKALGRHVQWAFHNSRTDTPEPLKLYTHGFEKLQATYTRDDQSIKFGFKKTEHGAKESSFTSLSSDVITHEVTHALLDGLRPYFMEQTNLEVLAFHEAFADIVALFQRFTYRNFVKAQLKRTNGDISKPTLLRMIAPELGQAISELPALRTFELALKEMEQDVEKLNPIKIKTLSDISQEEMLDPHVRGRILAEAIFDAFHTILDRKLNPLIKLATNGTGVLPEGEIPESLLNHIVHITCRTAAQFLNICIRAIDYCPPVHIEFGDYLRALITADSQLVSEDPYGYREAIIMACQIRGIEPKFVNTMSESALKWNKTVGEYKNVFKQLSLSNLKFDGDPAYPSDANEVERQAHLFAKILKDTPELLQEMGLHTPGDGYSTIEIVSIRPSRRVGPDDQISFDLIIEVIQSRTITEADQPQNTSLNFKGGATIVLGPLGEIRFIVRKRVDNDQRMEATKQFNIMMKDSSAVTLNCVSV